jgi:hypothetical protein
MILALYDESIEWLKLDWVQKRLKHRWDEKVLARREKFSLGRAGS